MKAGCLFNVCSQRPRGLRLQHREHSVNIHAARLRRAKKLSNQSQKLCFRNADLLVTVHPIEPM
jgi:hypothetical protein